MCGIAAALDVVGDRWAPLIVRDLLLGPLRFGELAEGMPGIGTNTLATRLKQLEEAGVLTRRLLALPERGTVYALTPRGEELGPILLELGRWGMGCMDRLPPDVSTRSRWLAGALPAFRTPGQAPRRPTTWSLHLTDGDFTVFADTQTLTVRAGVPAPTDHTITTDDGTLLGLLSRRLGVDEAIASGAATTGGETTGLDALVRLVRFPGPPGPAV